MLASVSLIACLRTCPLLRNEHDPARSDAAAAAAAATTGSAATTAAVAGRGFIVWFQGAEDVALWRLEVGAGWVSVFLAMRLDVVLVVCPVPFGLVSFLGRPLQP